MGLADMSFSFRVGAGLALERRNGVDDGLGFGELGDRQGAAQAADAALLVAALGEAVVELRPGVGPDGAGMDLAASTRRLVLMLLVKMPAARPYSVALARAMASVSVSKTSKVATGPKTSFWTRSVLTSSTSSRAGR